MLRIYEDEKVLEGIAPRSERLGALGERLSKQGAVKRARSLGMVLALELVFDEGYLGRSGWWVYEKALEKGAYLRPLGNTVYLVPPLNIPLADLDELCEVVESSVSEVIQSQTRFQEKEPD